MRYISHGGGDRLNVNRTAKNTLVLINVLRIQPYSLISEGKKFNYRGKDNTEKPGSESRSEHAT